MTKSDRVIALLLGVRHCVHHWVGDGCCGRTRAGHSTSHEPGQLLTSATEARRLSDRQQLNRYFLQNWRIDRRGRTSTDATIGGSIAFSYARSSSPQNASSSLAPGASVVGIAFDRVYARATRCGDRSGPQARGSSRA